MQDKKPRTIKSENNGDLRYKKAQQSQISNKFHRKSKFNPGRMLPTISLSRYFIKEKTGNVASHSWRPYYSKFFISLPLNCHGLVYWKTITSNNMRYNEVPYSKNFPSEDLGEKSCTIISFTFRPYHFLKHYFILHNL